MASQNRRSWNTALTPVPGQPAGGAYGYDWVGNRINPPADPNPMVYNAVDQLTSWPGMHSYTYDAARNLEAVKNPAGTSTLKSYSYTDDGLLETAIYAGGTRTLTNTWDADANRVKMTIDAGQTTTYGFVYDVTAGISAVIEEDIPSGTVYYFRQPNGALLSRVAGSSVRYYHFDELGSTRLLTDSSGTVTDKYAYDAYGALLAHDRLAGSIDQPYQFMGRFGYFTHYQESDFGLLQLGVRFYDTEVGRFTQRDPSGSALSGYTYVDGNPLLWIDPLGDKKKKPYNHQRCQKLRRTIDNLTKQIARQLHNLAEDKKNLRITCPCGPNKDSVQGHHNLILKYWDDRENAIKNYNAECETTPPIPPSPPSPKPSLPEIDRDDVEKGITWAAILAALAAAAKAAGDCARQLAPLL